MLVKHTGHLTPASKIVHQSFALRDLRRGMFARLALSFALVAVGLMLCAMGGESLGALAMGLSACFFISGAWSAIQMDCVDDL